VENAILKGANISLKKNPAAVVSFKKIIAANRGKEIKTTNMFVPNALKLKKCSRAAHSACSVEVEVDEELGIVNVTRAVTAVAAGSIINP